VEKMEFMLFTKSDAMKEVMAHTKLAKVSQIIDEVMFLANKKSKKFSMGIEETKKANEAGAIKSLVFSEKAIQDSDEQEIVDFLNDVKSKGGEIFSVDSTIDAGLRVSGLGGIISLLRFPLEY
jgi:Predicted RNA-binding proteins